MTKLELFVKSKINYPLEVVKSVLEVGCNCVDVEIQTPYQHEIITYHVTADGFLKSMSIREVQ